MKRALLTFLGLAILLAIIVFLLIPKTQRIFALGSRTVEYSFVIIDQENKRPIARANIDLWDDPFPPAKRQKIAQLIANDKGLAIFVRENNSVEDVIGISANFKLEGIRRHPPGVGTFVDRYWCILDISAGGYLPLQYKSLAEYEYDDKGNDMKAGLHRIEYTIPLRRK